MTPTFQSPMLACAILPHDTLATSEFHAMKILPWLLLVVCLSSPAFSQDGPKWQSRVVTGDDPGDSYTELSLQGSYVKPPSFVSAQPVLIVDCVKGKIRENYFSFGAVLSVHNGGNFPVELEAF